MIASRIRRFHAVQPQYTPQVDRQGLARGIVAGVNYGSRNVRDFTTNRTYAVNAGVQECAFGYGATIIQTTSNITVSPSFVLAAATDYTFVCAIANIGYTGTNPGIWASGTNFNIFQGTTGRPWIRSNGVEVLRPASGFAVPAGSNVVIGYRLRTAVDATFASDGVIRHRATHSTATTASTISQLGFQNTSVESVTGNYAFAAFWNRALADDELCQVTKNPWSVFVSPRRLWKVGEVGAGATFLPVWARGSTQTIGPIHVS